MWVNNLQEGCRKSLGGLMVRLGWCINNWMDAGKPYPAYKDLMGTWSMGDFDIILDR